MTRLRAGQQGGKLLLAAGALTLVNNYLPGNGHLDIAVLNTLGVLAVALGAACLRIPWERLPRRAPLLLLLAAFALLVVAGSAGGISAYSYAVYYVVVFVWVGIAQPPGTSLWVSPVAAASYLLPFMLADTPPETSISSVTVAVPVCVLVGETLARSVAKLEASREDLRSRVELVERLAASSGRLAQDLEVDAVRARLLASAREVFGAPAAALSSQGRVVQVDGLPPGVLGGEVDVPTGAVPASWGASGRRLSAPCDDGELHVLVERDRPDWPADLDVLQLLADQGASALVNARAYAAVVDQRAHEQAVVDVLADGVVVLDDHGLVQSCNEVAAGLLQSTSDSVLGSRPLLTLGPPGTPVVAAVGPRWIETVATPLPGTGERVVTMRDVSRQRALDEAKDLFLATTSHELRTPLTAIKGYVHMLQRRWDVLGEERRRQALTTVAERTDALVALTDHLLLGAKAGASRHSTARGPFDLNREVADAVQAMAEVSERHRVVLDLPPTPLTGLGEPTSLHPIVGQLVDNAVKYSPLGGTVHVRLRRTGDFAALEVADEGVGIPADAGEDLFAPFFQAGAINTREYGGVGLGLYIVRQLAEAQGGTVSAANRPGGGAVVTVTVPLARLPRPRPESDEAPAEVGSEGEQPRSC